MKIKPVLLAVAILLVPALLGTLAVNFLSLPESNTCAVVAAGFSLFWVFKRDYRNT